MMQHCPHLQQFVYTPLCPHGNYYEVNNSNCNFMEIALTMEFHRFFYIDDTDEHFAVSAQLTAQWRVPCHDFQTDTEEMTFRIDEGHTWAPNLLHINAVDDLTMESKYGRFYAMKRTGDGSSMVRFYWQKIGTFKSQCNLIFLQFPFDQQQCTIQILLKESSLVANLKVSTTSSSHSFGTDGQIPIDMVSDSSDWELVEIFFNDSIENIYNSNRSVGTFTLNFKRKADFYIFTLILPCLLLSSLSLTAFAIDPKESDRVMLCLTLLLSLIVIHSDVSQHIPPVPQRNLLSNYADLSILHSWIIIIYFSCMIFASNNSQWVKNNRKPIEIIALFWFSLQIIAINFYLFSMAFTP